MCRSQIAQRTVQRTVTASEYNVHAKGNHSHCNDRTCLHDERGVVHSDSPNDSSSLSAPSQPDPLSRPVSENSAVFACRSTVRSEYIQRMRDKRKLGHAHVGTNKGK